jgi:hypothetical protein
VQLGNQWKVEEYTLGMNQLMSDWRKKQFKWNEFPTQENLNPNVVIEDIELRE